MREVVARRRAVILPIPSSEIQSWPVGRRHRGLHYARVAEQRLHWATRFKLHTPYPSYFSTGIALRSNSPLDITFAPFPGRHARVLSNVTGRIRRGLLPRELVEADKAVHLPRELDPHRLYPTLEVESYDTLVIAKISGIRKRVLHKTLWITQ